ncbi:MAG TPA: isoaspartyl peptidase/L-asparaginase, partial [Polyangiales bacterium]|nr:isoaspartyl peptidase/L-asparaginase [Polyangiales bacterium]
LGQASGYSLIVHGGAGEVTGPRLDSQIEGCLRAAERAKQILESGGRALDAVQAAVMELEDDSRFNAATGGVLTCEGNLELDAAIMEGHELRAGAVCGLSPFKNPIAIARAALDDGKHVLYCGPGAAAFAKQRGFTPSDPAAMITEEARTQLESYLAQQTSAGPAGTVGAVARDKQGRLAAATSTGGVLGKRPGRVGDSPLLGAGTYADDILGAASATGLGEGIMRIGLCGRIVQALPAAAQPGPVGFDVLELMKQRTAARGGVIMIDHQGRIGWARSTQSMAYAATWENHNVVAGG